jgi:GTP cyclohydrolase IA
VTAETGRLARLPVSRRAAPRDLDAAEKAAGALLAALGVDLSGESLRDTPGRMARALDEMLTPRGFDLTTFPNDDGYKQLVVEREIGFRSVCAHHFLPFTGHAYIGYLPGDRILGLSKLPRVVELFAHRPAGPGTADPAGRRLAR